MDFYDKYPINSVWTHTNGNKYRILMITNTDSTNSDYQPTVVYQGENNKLWSRLLSNWDRSMTRLEIKEVA